MKLPTAIVTKHKIRDAKILSLYAQDAWTFEKIGQRFGVSATRIGQIIYKNRGLLDYDRKWERAKRVTHLKRLLEAHPNNMGSKTTIDIIDSVRSEIEGKDGSDKVGGGDTRIIIIRADSAQSVEVKENTIAGMSIIRPAVAAAVEATNATN